MTAALLHVCVQTSCVTSVTRKSEHRDSPPQALLAYLYTYSTDASEVSSVGLPPHLFRVEVFERFRQFSFRVVEYSELGEASRKRLVAFSTNWRAHLSAF